jgi:HMG (high mobility group) box
MKLNKYINFSNVHRDRVRAQHPHLKITEIAKILGEMWRTLDDDEKEEYSNPDYIGDCDISN